MLEANLPTVGGPLAPKPVSNRITLPPVRIAVTVKGLSILSGPMPAAVNAFLTSSREAFLTIASVTARSIEPSCRLNTSMSPTLYFRLSAARCACAAPMNETGPFSPKTSAAPALPRTRSRREISNIALPPCLILIDPSPIGAPSFARAPAPVATPQQRFYSAGVGGRRQASCHSWRGLRPVGSEFAPGLIGEEGFDKLAVLLRHEHGPAVSSAKGEVCRLPAQRGHPAGHAAVGVDDRNLAGAWPRDEDAAGDVGAQAVEFEMVELGKRLCGRRKVVAVN